MVDYTEVGEAALRSAGWTEGRSVPTVAYEKAYASEGYSWTPEVAKFLGEFGGLRFGKLYGDFADHLNVEPDLAISCVVKEWVDDYAEFLAQDLFPAGMAFRGRIMTSMTSERDFFGGSDDQIVSFGHGIRELLGRLLMGTGERLR